MTNTTEPSWEVACRVNKIMIESNVVKSMVNGIAFWRRRHRSKIEQQQASGLKIQEKVKCNLETVVASEASGDGSLLNTNEAGCHNGTQEKENILQPGGRRVHNLAALRI